MATVAQTTTAAPTIATRTVAGATGGFLGGLVFGLMMQALDMLPMVAMLVGSESVPVGWGLHLSISVALGIGFGLLAARGLDAWGTGVTLGLGYGVVWWVLGALVSMPAALGMPLFQLNTMAWQSLMGHLVFGAILGAVSVAIVRASARSEE